VKFVTVLPPMNVVVMVKLIGAQLANEGPVDTWNGTVLNPLASMAKSG
jgi:hypothetical protein